MFQIRAPYDPPIRVRAFGGVRVGAVTYTKYTDGAGKLWTIYDRFEETGWMGEVDKKDRFLAQSEEYGAREDDVVATFNPEFTSSTKHGVISKVDLYVDLNATWRKTGEGTPRFVPAEECNPLFFDAKCDVVETYSSSSAEPVHYSSSDSSLAGVQRALISLRYDLGPSGADGKMGLLTSKAIIAFKGRYGLTANDTIDEAFRSELTRATAPKTPPSSAWMWIAGVLVLVVGGVVFMVVW